MNVNILKGDVMMAKYRIRVEQIEGDNEDLGKIGSPEGMECTGYIVMGLNENEEGADVSIKDLSAVNMALMFAKEKMLVAAAKAGEALDSIIHARNAEAFEEDFLSKLLGNESSDDE